MKPRNINANNFSIYVEAKKILEQFKAKSELVKNREDIEQNLWLDDDYQMQYKSLHSVRITREESGLTSDQFFAISELIDGVVSGSRDNKEINVNLRQGTEDIELTAKYFSGYFPHRLAPLGQLNFAKMLQKLEQLAQLVHHAGWKSISDNEVMIVFEGKDASQKQLDFNYDLHFIEKACKEFDNNFHLNKQLLEAPLSISVNKASLEIMRSLIANKIEVKPELKPTLQSHSTIRTLLSQTPVAKEEKENSDIPPSYEESQQEILMAAREAEKVSPPPYEEALLEKEMFDGAPGGPRFM